MDDDSDIFDVISLVLTSKNDKVITASNPMIDAKQYSSIPSYIYSSLSDIFEILKEKL